MSYRNDGNDAISMMVPFSSPMSTQKMRTYKSNLKVQCMDWLCIDWLRCWAERVGGIECIGIVGADCIAAAAAAAAELVCC